MSFTKVPKRPLSGRIIRTTYTRNEGLRRVNLSLPSALYDELTAVVREDELTYVEAIRQAIAYWLEQRTSEKMRAGYQALADEEHDLLEEFKHVDREIW